MDLNVTAGEKPRLFAHCPVCCVGRSRRADDCHGEKSKVLSEATVRRVDNHRSIGASQGEEAGAAGFLMALFFLSPSLDTQYACILVCTSL
jgi:hypothetical protein